MIKKSSFYMKYWDLIIKIIMLGSIEYGCVNNLIYLIKRLRMLNISLKKMQVIIQLGTTDTSYQFIQILTLNKN